MKWVRGKQKGFTLVELLVVIPIIALVGGAASAVIIQILRSNNISADTLAIRQVQLAGDWVSQDGIQSPSYNITIADNITASDGFLKMSWNSYWTEGVVYHSQAAQITYTLRASGSQWKMERHEVTVHKYGTTADNTDSTIVVGEYLDASQMACTWDPGGRSFTFKVVATVVSRTQSREYKVQPRVVI